MNHSNTPKNIATNVARTFTKPFHIGIAGLSCECSTFSPLLSCERDFLVSSGEELGSNYAFFADYPDITVTPLIRARAIPGGSIEPDFYDRFKAQLLEGLAAHAPWDGIYLDMHGAANVHGRDDVEGDMLAAIRKVVGPDCVISASYDLHGNVSQRVVDSIDMLTAYRTAPHLDYYETQQRAFALLMRALHEGVKPHMAFRPVPVLVPGERSSTEWEPAASLYAAIQPTIDQFAIWDTSILIGYVWADEPRAMGCTIAIGLDAEQTNAAAHALAQQFWAVREGFQFGVTSGTVDECIHLAMQETATPVVISDSGDNPTAGGVGDIPYVLSRLLVAGVESALVAAITDGAAVTACEAAGVGATAALTIGGKQDPIHGQPLPVEATVVSLHELSWPANPRAGVAVTTNHVAVVQVQGVTVVLTERRTPFHHIQTFTQLDLEPHVYQIVVVKMGYLVPEINQLAKRALLALSPGAVNQDIEHLPYKRIQRPMYPMDRTATWA
ncbi:MAG: M81 family metallopeptidase [Caldilineaceae bacterium]|nr:M81 family metallopeptidase [Caldilineaceae bacterium]